MVNFHIKDNPAAEKLAMLLWQAHYELRATLRSALSNTSQNLLASVSAYTEADTIFGIDKIAEECLLNFFYEHQNEAPPFILVGEFEFGESMQFGKGEAQFRVLFDPIDGTRLVMYSKASGWILSGIMPEKGDATNIADVIFSLQTEIPLSKYAYADTLWAATTGGSYRLRENFFSNEKSVIRLKTSNSTSLENSFVSFVKLFPRGKKNIAGIEEEFLSNVFGDEKNAATAVFEDQHLATAGQLYALIEGKEKLVVDIRPHLNTRWRRQNKTTGLCAHPYDLCSWLIAHEAGVVIVAMNGKPFHGTASAAAEIGWLGFENKYLWKKYGGKLLQTLESYGIGMTG